MDTDINLPALDTTDNNHKKENCSDSTYEQYKEDLKNKIKNNWGNTIQEKTLAAPVGKSNKSSEGITYIDLHESKMGPHMIVAGTTGSGKTETLITYIVSLCVTYSPDYINFLLIDMKGGNFTRRLKNLPHIVGCVTDIDGNEYGYSAKKMLQRFLFVLKAEIYKRKNILKDEKVDDIDEYIRKHIDEYTNTERKRLADEELKICSDYVNFIENKETPNSEANSTSKKLAHLFIIVDEFTELKRFSSDSSDVDYISELTSIARVGRSLGIHLILTSQNIEGAITEDIRVNVNARLCFKVATAQASKEMLGSTLAFDYGMPGNGRAYLVWDNGRQREYFQAAYSKAECGMGVPTEIICVHDSGRYDILYDSKDFGKNTRTQLELYVEAICELGGLYSPSCIFLEPLSKEYQIFFDEKKCVSSGSDKERKIPSSNMDLNKIPLGIVDDPKQQDQPITSFDIDNHNLAIFGGPGSGKTTLLKTVVEAIHCLNIDSKIYYLDCIGSRSNIAEYEKIYAYFNADNSENVKCLINVVKEHIRNNINLKKQGTNPKPVLFIIDNINVLINNEDDMFFDEILEIAREGRSAGVLAIITSNDTVKIGRLLNYFDYRIAFDMPVDSYDSIFSKVVVKPIAEPGRGLFWSYKKRDEILEFQAFINKTTQIFVQNTEEEKKENKQEKIIDKKLKPLKEDYFFDDKEIISDEKKNNDNILTIGQDYIKQDFFELDVKTDRFIGIYGRKNFGMENLLNLLIKQIAIKEIRWNILLFANKKAKHEVINDANKGLITTINDLFANDCTSTSIVEKNGKELKFNKEYTKNTVFILADRRFYLKRFRPYFETILFETINSENNILIMYDVTGHRNIASNIDDLDLTAFLLDDIGSFVSGRGSMSVFADMDANELKAEFTKCSFGDAYYYRRESGEYNKIRVLRA